MTDKTTAPHPRVAAGYILDVLRRYGCERLDALDHTLRYGEPTRADLLVAASVVAAVLNATGVQR